MICERIAEIVFSRAKNYSHEVAALAGVCQDLTGEVVLLIRGPRSRGHFQIDQAEFVERIAELASKGCRYFMRIHAGPAHITPSLPDVRGLGNMYIVRFVRNILLDNKACPDLVDMIVSQTTGRYGVYVIEQPAGWRSTDDKRLAYHPVDPLILWRIENGARRNSNYSQSNTEPVRERAAAGG